MCLIQSILLQMDLSGIFLFLITITSLGICGICLEYVIEYMIPVQFYLYMIHVQMNILSLSKESSYE